MEHQQIAGLLRELASLCDASCASTSVEHLIDEASMLLRLESLPETPEQLTDKDRDLVLSFLNNKKQASESEGPLSAAKGIAVKSVSQKLFLPMNRIIIEVEKDLVLIKPLQNLLNLKGSSIGGIGGVEQQKLSKALRKTTDHLSAKEVCVELSQFLKNVVGRRDEGCELKTHLVIVKLLLCLLETDGKTFDVTKLHIPKFVLRSLASPTVISRHGLDKHLHIEKEKERLQTFETGPRVLICSGDPGKLSSLEVQGSAVGFLTSICIKHTAGERYFEVTLKGTIRSGIRIGWMQNGTNLDTSGAMLGGSAQCAVFDGQTGFFFHDALASCADSAAATILAGAPLFLASNTSSVPVEAMAASTSRLARFDQLLSFGIDRDAVHRMMLQDGIPAEQAGKLLTSRAAVQASEDFDENMDGIASLFGQKMVKSASAIKDIGTAVAAGGVYLADSDSYNWTAGTVLGCYINAATGIVRFFVDGVEIGKNSSSPLRIAAMLAGGQGVCPVFSCCDAAGLEFNIGQMPFTFPHPSAGSICPAGGPRSTEQVSSYYLHLEPSAQSHDGNADKADKGTGIVISRISSEKMKGFTLEISMRLTEDGFLLMTGSSQGRNVEAPCSPSPNPNPNPNPKRNVEAPSSLATRRCLLSSTLVSSTAISLGCSILIDRHGCLIFEMEGQDDIKTPPGTIRPQVWQHVCVIYPMRGLGHPRELAILIDGIIVHRAEIPENRQVLDKVRFSSLCVGGRLQVSTQAADVTSSGGVYVCVYDGQASPDVPSAASLTDLDISSASIARLKESCAKALDGSYTMTDVLKLWVDKATLGKDNAKGKTYYRCNAQGSDVVQYWNADVTYNRKSCTWKFVAGSGIAASAVSDGLPANSEYIPPPSTIAASPGAEADKAGVMISAPSTPPHVSSSAAAGGKADSEPTRLKRQHSEPSRQSETIANSATTMSFIGDVCEVRLWSGARSSDSIVNTLGRSRISGVEPSLILLLSFEEGAGATIHDAAFCGGNIRPSSSISIHGSCKWRQHDPRFLEDIRYRPPQGGAMKRSDFSKSLLAQTLPYLVGIVDDVDDLETEASFSHSEEQIDIKIVQILAAIVQKFSLSSDRFIETESAKREKSWYRKIQDRLLSTQSIAQPYVLNFLMLNSLLRQLIRMDRSNPTDATSSDILRSLSLALLRVVRVNFLDVASSGLSPAQLGLQYSRMPEGGSGGQKTAFVSKLLITLLYFVSDDRQTEEDDAKPSAQPSSICSEAVGAIVAAFNVFFPHAHDQAFFLICLLSKKFRLDADFLAQNAPPDLIQALSSPRVTPMGQDETLPSDPFMALLAMSKAGDEALLRATCEHLSIYSNAIKLVPTDARPALLPAGGCDSLSKAPGMDAVHSELLIPRIGDLVCRGPHWQYGDQDGGADKLGVIFEIVEWAAGQKGLRVRWSSGSLNVYRWAVVDRETLAPTAGGAVATAATPKFDVSLLRVATSAVGRPYPSFGPSDEASGLSGGSASATSASPREESGGKRDLLYTPEEVNLSLVEEIGDLTKRTVLAYIQEIAPLAWQEVHKLTWSLNTLVKNFTSESTAALYRTFYETFSSKVAPPPANVASKTSQASQRDEEGASLQLSQLLGLLLKNVNHQPSDSVVDVDVKEATSPSLTLISYIQGLLVGVFPAISSSLVSGEQRMVHVDVKERLFEKPFPDGDGGYIAWNWRSGTWKNSSAAAGASEEGQKTEISREVQYFRDVGFYDEEMPDDLSLPTDYTVQHSGNRNKGFRTCSAYVKIEPDSGIFRWYVRIENFGLGKRGNIIIGVATAACNREAYLGQDGESWGLSCSKELFHKGRPIKSDFGHRISSGTQLELTLDTFLGTLTIKDVRKDGGADIEPAFTTRDGLRGKTVYPSFSLYNPGDCLSVLPALDHDQYARATPVQPPSHTMSRGIPVGAPSALLVKFCLQMVKTSSDILQASHTAIRSPQVSICLVQLLGSISRWQHVPLQHLRTVYCALNDFISVLRSAIEAALMEERRADDRSIDPQCSHLLRQLTCIVTAYMGRLNSAMIVCDSSRCVDNRFVFGQIRLESARLAPGALQSSGDGTSALVVGADVHIALAGKLFAFGLKPEASESSILWAELQRWTGDSIVLWRWLAKHDRMEAERKMGDASLLQLVKHYMFVVLHHSGFLSLALNICRQLEDVSAGEVVAFIDAHKPPAILMNAWKSAIQIKYEALKIKQGRGIQYPLIVHCFSTRLSFLFELEESMQDQIVNISSGSQPLLSLLDDLAKSSNAHCKIVAEVTALVKVFVIQEQCLNTHSIAFFRAALKNVEEISLMRSDAFFSLRGSLDVLGAVGADMIFGWAAKCALLLHFPAAMRNEGKNLLVRPVHAPLPPRRSIKGSDMLTSSESKLMENSGHYLYCLEGCAKANKMRLRGAFDTLYMYIANELGSDDVEPAVQLCLINCLGVRILEDDHAMISRVNIFYAIHELLTAALMTDGAKPESAAEISEQMELAKLTKCAMKLFILLTLQVAASGERTDKSSVMQLEAPIPYKVKSGPATLSREVFDILYKQLSVLASMLRTDLAGVSALGASYCKFNPDNKDKPAMVLPSVEVSEDAMVVLSEATALLLHLASHEVCQRLLARPKWIALLLNLLDTSPVVCQQRVLLLIFDLLPACAIEDLHSPDSVEIFNFCSHLPGKDVSEKIINKLIRICGKVAITVDLEDPFVVTKGTPLVSAFSSMIIPQAAECVAILRRLLASPAWSALISSKLLETVSMPVTSALLTDKASVCDMVASLFILGGFVDSEYVDCPVAIDTDEQVGVIARIVQGTDNIEVAFSKPQDPRKSTPPVKEMPLERVRLLNRFPIESLDISPALVLAVLKLADVLLFDAAVSELVQASANGRHPEEEKTETHLEEEKSDANVRTVQATRDEFNKRTFNLATLRCACSKVLVGLSTNPRSVDCLLNVLDSSAPPAVSEAFTRNLLSSSIVCTRSGGLADIPIYETYLSLVLNERRRALAASKIAENTLKLQAEKEAHEKAVTSREAAQLRVLEEKPSAVTVPATPVPITELATGDSPPLLPGAALEWDMQRSDPRPPQAPSCTSSMRPYSGGSDGGPSGPGTMSVGSGEEEELDLPEMVDGDEHDNDQEEDDEEDDDPEAGILESLTNMGFPKRWCEIALEMCGGEVDEALNYILSNGDQLEAVVAGEQAGSSRLRGAGGEGEEIEHMELGVFSDPNQHEEEDEEEEFMRQIEETAHSMAHIQSLMVARRGKFSRNRAADVPLTEREFHYDDSQDKLFPLYSEPNTSSERIGSAFPGDAVRALVEFINPLDPTDHWYKVNLLDFRDDPQPGEVEVPGEAFGWAQRYIRGVEVILPGQETGASGDLADPPSESWRIDRVYKVIGTRGAMVRTGIETTSEEIMVLNVGDTARAVEETFNSDGSIRLRISEPVSGWISKLPTLLSKVSDNTVDEDWKNAPVVSDWANLECIDDDMEIWGGNDIYRRDERFFKSLQGSHYQRCKDTNRTKIYSMHHRRLRVTGSSGYAACAQSLSSKSIDALQGIYSSAAQTLTNLNCRKAFLAIIIRSTKESENGSALMPGAYTITRQVSVPLQPRESLPVAPIPPLVIYLLPPPTGGKISDEAPLAATISLRAKALIDRLQTVSLQNHKGIPVDASDSARAAFNFYSLLRLAIFRGQPHSCTGLEWLALSEIDALAMAVGKMSRSLDEIMFPLVASLLKKENYIAQQETFRSSLLTFFLSSVAYDIWQACSGGQVEQSWDDSSYEDLLDDGSIQQANMHFCQWITALLLHMDISEVTFVVFRAWSIGLRGTSMSLKRIVFDQLSHILSSFHRENDMQNADCQNALGTLLSFLPVQRLKVIGSRRLWYELEDRPAYSRYLQRLLHFLSVIESSSALLPEDSAAIEAAPAEISKTETAAPPATSDAAEATDVDPAHPTARPVLKFNSAKSFVQLNPQKDMQGSWTVEMWIKREVQPFEVDAIAPDGDQPSWPASPSRGRPEQVPSSFGSALFDRKAFMRFTEGKDEPRDDEVSAARRALQENEFGSNSQAQFGFSLSQEPPPINPEIQNAALYGGSLLYSQAFGQHPFAFQGGSLRVGGGYRGLASIAGLRDFGAGVSGGSGLQAALGGSPFAAQLAALPAGLSPREQVTGKRQSGDESKAEPAFLAAQDAKASQDSAGPAANPRPPARGASRRAAHHGPLKDSRHRCTLQHLPKSVSNTRRWMCDVCGLSGDGSGTASFGLGESYSCIPCGWDVHPHCFTPAAESKSDPAPPAEPEKPHELAPAIYLLSSRDWHIKLQAGGRVFGLNEDEDPLQHSDPVAEKAFCMSVGSRDPRNPPERTFDYIVPTNRWVHLAIVCKSGGQGSQSPSSATLALYADGVLQDSVSTKFSLPISMIGSNKKGQSFCGSMAEMRIWSCVRSACEIRRDMLTDISGGKFLRYGLIAHLQCKEGSGFRTFDGAGMINTCKLHAVDWVHAPGPVMKPHAMPQSLLGETEDNSNILGDSDRSENDMVEMTGVLRRSSFYGYVELANPSAEVVCLCYRYVSPEDEPVRQLEGYLDWCERNVRCCLSGSHDCVTGTFTFCISPSEPGASDVSGSIVMLGPPENLSYLRKLTFTGAIKEDGIKGKLSLLCAAPPQPPLPLGQARFDKLAIPGRCAYKKGPRGAYGATEVLTLREDSDAVEPATVTIELQSYNAAERKERVLCQGDAEVFIDSSPFYGLVQNDGCAWVEWTINKTWGETVFGACLAGAFDPASQDKDFRSWSYTITGTLSHAGEMIHSEPCGDGDVVGIQFDMDHGTLAFYRNSDLLHEFSDITAHPAVSRSPDTAEGSTAALHSNLPNALRGIRPFVSLVSPGDSVTFKGLKEGAVVVQYPESDPLGRGSYTGIVRKGCFSGKGVLRFIDKTQFWYGNWINGLQDGVQLRIKVDPATLSESVLSVNVFHEGMDVCDLTDSMEELPEVTSWRAEAIASSLARTSSGERAAAVAAATAANSAATTATASAAGGGEGKEADAGGDRALVLPMGARSPGAASGAASARSIPALQRSTSSGAPASNPARRDDVTIKIRDSKGADLHLKMNRNVRLQKAFELYASKRSVHVSTLEFLLDGEIIKGDCTPEMLEFGENEMIEVVIDAELQRLLRTSTAPYIIKIIYKDGATVRTGVEIEELSTGRHMQVGETAEAYFRTETKEGIGRFLVADDPNQKLSNTHGWISERLRGTTEEKVTIVVRELFSKPRKFVIVKKDGAKWRKGAAMDSEDGGMIPEGVEVEVAEMRLVHNIEAAPTAGASGTPASAPASDTTTAQPMGPLGLGLGLGSEADLVRRLRIVSPPAYEGSWISCKDHITVPVDNLPAAKTPQDNDVQREVARRAQIRMLRMIQARDKAQKEAESLGGAGPAYMHVEGSLDVTSENLFLINGAQRSPGVNVSSDFKTVIASPHVQRDRAMALGSRGFARGVHYWEVQINSVQNGNVFVGVAPAEYVQPWGGYGFVNYRVKISLTTDETLYGRWTAPGDILGILLDMTAGTLSFFHDGPEPFSDSSKVRNMGVSHRYLRRASGSRYPVLYPCFGLKMSGDSISIRKCKWISRKGNDAPELYSQLMHAKNVVSHWRNTYLPQGTHPLAAQSLSSSSASRSRSSSGRRGGEPLPPNILHDMYSGYLSSCIQKRYVSSRPGLQVGLHTDQASIERAAGKELTAKFRIRINKKFTSRYGVGHIVGARGRQLWYMLDLTDSGDVGAWYWSDELESLVGRGLVTFDTSADLAVSGGGSGAGADATTTLRTGVGLGTLRTPPSSPPPSPLQSSAMSQSPATSSVPLMTLAEFTALSFPLNVEGSVAARSGGRSNAWSMEEDVALCSAVNAYADKFGEDPCRLYPELLDAFRLQIGVLPRRTSDEVRCRYAALCVLNKAAELVLPVCDFGAESSVGGINGVAVLTDYERELRARFYPSYLYTGRFSSQALLDVKRVTFFRTKLKFWSLLLKESTTNTSEPPDEFDRPSDIKEILLNRVVARSLLDRKESTTFSERLKRSVFGQLMEALASWDDSFMRRAYQHFQDAGQSRAFFVKFEGEGSDDQGGPYRAVFNTITEEAEGLLDLLVLCPNGAADGSETFLNRDKFLFNTRLTQSQPPDSLLYVFFGKAIAIACRHSIQVSLSLPSAIWKPLLGEAVGMSDLRDMDTRTSTFLLKHSSREPKGEGTAGSSGMLSPGASPRLLGDKDGDPRSSEEGLADLLPQLLSSLQETNAALTPRAIRRIIDCLGSPTEEKEAARKVCLLVEHLQLVSQNDGISQLFRGLDAVLPTEVFPIFSPAELEVVFCGAANIDVEVLKSATIYEGVTPFDPHILFFWESMEAMTQEERSKLINFCSGRSRLPTSASSFTMSFKLAKPPPEAQENPDNYLPKASTCFFTLYLPQYSSLEVRVAAHMRISQLYNPNPKH